MRLVFFCDDSFLKQAEIKFWKVPWSRHGYCSVYIRARYFFDFSILISHRRWKWRKAKYWGKKSQYRQHRSFSREFLIELHSHSLLSLRVSCFSPDKYKYTGVTSFLFFLFCSALLSSFLFFRFFKSTSSFALSFIQLSNSFYRHGRLECILVQQLWRFLESLRTSLPIFSFLYMLPRALPVGSCNYFSLFWWQPSK